MQRVGIAGVSPGARHQGIARGSHGVRLVVRHGVLDKGSAETYDTAVVAEENPFEAPTPMADYGVQLDSEVPHDGDYGKITSEMVLALKRTRPWVLFLAILGFVGAGFMLVVGTLVMTRGSLDDDVPVSTGILGVGYMVGAMLECIPSFLLYRYAKALRLLSEEPGPSYVALALEGQRVFWRAVGVMASAAIGLYLVGFGLYVAVFLLNG